MCKKRGQTWSLETYLAIAVFLIALIFFYGLITVSKMQENIGIEVEEIGRALISGKEMRDGKLTNEELGTLINMNCTELKTLFNTNKDICIYLLDSSGNLITNGSHVIHGIGCPGINISGLLCGSAS